ncbi:hypothetical protein AB0D46_28065 [Streptomyces sp. NPDC048383]|uniref:hypothetical protein n=1 Tax=Streptomyces sp. NPDC048383 TaxID=3155386 RepID=UPI00342B526E
MGIVERVDYRESAALPIFPPIGPALAALADPRANVTDAATEPVTDENRTWPRPVPPAAAAGPTHGRPEPPHAPHRPGRFGQNREP